MPLTEAKFSQYMDEFVGHADIAGAFGDNLLAREVNVLDEQEFPLLGYWLDDSDGAPGLGSDGEIGDQVTFGMTVATQLGDGEKQHVELGKLIKVVKDLADKFATANPVDFKFGRWFTSSGASNKDGSKVWASTTVTMEYSYPRGNY